MESECCLIANPEGYGWEFASKINEILGGKYGRFEINPVHIEKFRDGEIKPKIENNIRKRTCFFIHDSILNPAEWFLELCLINQAMKNSSAQRIIDVLPYMKFARQDRKDESRVPISAKVIADVICMYADSALTIDVHNLAITGFYSIPFDNLDSFPIVSEYLKTKHLKILENLVVMSPDMGGAKRAKDFAKRLDIEAVVGYKTRPQAGEVEIVKILGEVKEKNVFIVDDLIDSGNTLLKACEAARREGANKVYTYCTHGLFTCGIEKIKECFDYVFVGDTLKQEKNSKVEIISFAPLFAEAIYRISQGKSLSELFE